MHAAGIDFQQIVELAPEWQSIVLKVQEQGTINSVVATELGKPTACVYAVLEEIGAHSIFIKLTKAGDRQSEFLKLIRDNYLLVLANKMFRSNGALRRFFSERFVPFEDQKGQTISMGVEMSIKLEGLLKRNLQEGDLQGFKLMLPAYVQRSVNNAVIDYIKEESHWEKQAVPDTHEEGEEDVIARTASDLDQIPEHIALSGEKVGYLNELRKKLKNWYATADASDQSFAVIDCMFGLGLTKHSTLGKELTMRECCDVLKLEGDTQARKIARCQVLLDKGMDKIRHLLREQMPGVVDCWQKEINVNVASRRDLDHQLDLTEGEVERLVVARQYVKLEQLVERNVVKADRLPALKKKGAVAAFVPVDLNAATAREMTDILGIAKDAAQRIVAARPLAGFPDLFGKNLLPSTQLNTLKQRGAVLKAGTASTAGSGGKAALDLNRADEQQMKGAGLSSVHASLIIKVRPFESWAEVEQFLACDEQTWANIRRNFSLGERSS
jgi:DNA uptake protein ComE-like DNA-binding protein